MNDNKTSIPNSITSKNMMNRINVINPNGRYAGEGEGRSKKEAEQAAAGSALQKLLP